jgi:hypothetical protein
MKKYISVLIVFFCIVTYSFSLVTGHYITNGKGCYAAKSVIGGKSQVCNCLPNEKPVVVGALLTSVSNCSADSISHKEIKFLPLPGVIQKKAIEYLTSYRAMLRNMNTVKSLKLSGLVTTLLEVVRSQSIPLYHQCEIDYLQTFDSMSPEEKEKIEYWIKINEYTGE